MRPFVVSRRRGASAQPTPPRLVQCPAPSACSALPCSSPSRSSRPSPRSRSAAAPTRCRSRTPAPIARYGLPIAKLLVEPRRRRHDRRARARGVRAEPEAPRVRPRPRCRRRIRRGVDRRERRDRVLHVPARHGGALRPRATTFGQKLGQFLTTIELGQAWLTTTLVAAAVTVLCFAVRNHTALVFVAALAVAVARADGAAGPRGGRRGPQRRDRRARLHLVFAAVWLGGLLTIVLLQRALGTRAARGRARAVLDGRAGLLHRRRRVGLRERGAAHRHARRARHPLRRASCSSRSRRSSRSACFGAVQRRFLIGRMRADVAHGAPAGASPPWLLVCSSSASSLHGPRVGRRRRTRAHGDAGRRGRRRVARAHARRDPHRASRCRRGPTAIRYFTEWNLDLLWVLACGFGIFFYLAGVLRLRRRGDHWPVYRTVLWVAGLLLLALRHERRRQRLRAVPVLGAHARRTWC